MAHTPKKRLLPKNILERTDAEIAEKLFGKEAKRELDKLVEGASEKSMTKDQHTPSYVSST